MLSFLKQKQQYLPHSPELDANDLLELLQNASNKFAESFLQEDSELNGFIDVLKLCIEHYSLISPLEQLKYMLEKSLLLYIYRNLQQFDAETIINYALRQILYKNRLFEVFSCANGKKYTKESIFSLYQQELLSLLFAFQKQMADNKSEPLFQLDPRLPIEQIERPLPDLLAGCTSFDAEAKQVCGEFLSLFSDFPSVFANFIDFLDDAHSRPSKCYIPDYSCLAFLAELTSSNLEYAHSLCKLIAANRNSTFTPYTYDQLSEILAFALLTNPLLIRTFFAVLAGFLGNGVFYEQNLEYLKDERTKNLEFLATMLNYNTKCQNLHEFCPFVGVLLDELHKKGPEYYIDVLRVVKSDYYALIRALPFCFKNSEGNALANIKEAGESDIECIERLVGEKELLQQNIVINDTFMEDKQFYEMVGEIINGAQEANGFSGKRIETEYKIIASFSQYSKIERLNELRLNCDEKFEAINYEHIQWNSENSGDELVDELLADIDEDDFKLVFGNVFECSSKQELREKVKDRELDFVAYLLNSRYELMRIVPETSKCINFIELEEIFSRMQNAEPEGNEAEEEKKEELSQQEIKQLYDDTINVAKVPFMQPEIITEEILANLYTNYLSLLSVGLNDCKYASNVLIELSKQLLDDEFQLIYNETGFISNSEFSFIISPIEEIVEQIGRNIFRRIAYKQELGELFKLLNNNSGVYRKYYGKNSEDIKDAHEYIQMFLLEYDASICQIENSKEFSPDCRFAINFPLIQEEIDNLYTGVEGKEHSTYSPETKQLTAFFYSFFGNLIDEELVLLKECQNFLRSSIQYDDWAFSYTGIKSTRQEIDEYYENVIDCLNHSGLSKNSFVSISVPEIQLLFARFMLCNIDACECYLLFLSNFFEYKGEIFEEAKKLLGQKDNKCNPFLCANIALFLKDHRLNIINAHQYSYYEIYVVQQCIMKLLDVKENGWKTLLLFMNYLIKLLEFDFRDHYLILLLNIICSITKHSERDKLWLRNLGGELKELSNIDAKTVISSNLFIENDDDFIFTVVCQLLLKGQLEYIFEFNFGQVKINPQSILFIYEPEESMVSILSNFQTVFLSLSKDILTRYHSIDCFYKEKSNTAIINAIYLYDMMTEQETNVMLELFEFSNQKSTFEQLFDAFDNETFIIDQQKQLHNYEYGSQFNLFYERLSPQKIVLFSNLRQTIFDVADGKDATQEMSDYIAELINSQWEIILRNIIALCNDYYFPGLLEASQFLQQGQASQFVGAVIGSRCLHELFTIVSNLFYYFVQVGDYDSNWLMFMSINELQEISHEAFQKNDQASDSESLIGQVKSSVIQLMRKQPDQGELCDILVDELRKMEQLSTDEFGDQAFNILGEITQNILSHNQCGENTIARVLEAIPRLNMPKELAVLYYDIKNLQSVYQQDDELFAQAFFRAVIQKCQLADFLSILHENKQQISEYYRNGSVFDSDQFGLFLDNMREKEQKLRALNAKFAVLDPRFEPYEGGDVDSIVRSVTNRPAALPASERETILVQVLFNFSLESAKQYFNLVLQHINNLISLRELPISHYVEVFKQEIDYKALQRDIEDVIGMLSQYDSCNNELFSLGDEELVQLLYNHLLLCPNLLATILLIEAGVLGNRTLVVQGLLQGVRTELADPHFCTELALKLSGLHHDEKTLLFLPGVNLHCAEYEWCNMQEVQYLKWKLEYYSETLATRDAKFAMVSFIEFISLLFIQNVEEKWRSNLQQCVKNEADDGVNEEVEIIADGFTSMSEIHFMTILMLIEQHKLAQLFGGENEGINTLLFNGIPLILLFKAVCEEFEAAYDELDDSTKVMFEHSQIISHHRMIYSSVEAFNSLSLAFCKSDNSSHALCENIEHFLGDYEPIYEKDMQNIETLLKLKLPTQETETIDKTMVEELESTYEQINKELKFTDSITQELLPLVGQILMLGTPCDPLEILANVLSEQSFILLVIKESIDLNNFIELLIEQNKVYELASFLNEYLNKVQEYYWGYAYFYSENIEEILKILEEPFVFLNQIKDMNPTESNELSNQESCEIQESNEKVLQLTESSDSEEELMIESSFNGHEEQVEEQSEMEGLRREPDYLAMPSEQEFLNNSVGTCEVFKAYSVMQCPMFQNNEEDFFEVSCKQLQNTTITVTSKNDEWVTSDEELEMFKQVDISHQAEFIEEDIGKDACDMCGAPLKLKIKLSDDPYEKECELNEQNGVYCYYTHKCLCAECAKNEGEFQMILPNGDNKPHTVLPEIAIKLEQLYEDPRYIPDDLGVKENVERQIRFFDIRKDSIESCERLNSHLTTIINLNGFGEGKLALSIKNVIAIKADLELIKFEEKYEKFAYEITKKYSSSVIGNALQEKLNLIDYNLEQKLNYAILLYFWHCSNCEVCTNEFATCGVCNEKLISFKFNIDMYFRLAGGLKNVNAYCQECGRVVHKTCCNESGICNNCIEYLEPKQ